MATAVRRDVENIAKVRVRLEVLDGNEADSDATGVDIDRYVARSDAVQQDIHSPTSFPNLTCFGIVKNSTYKREGNSSYTFVGHLAVSFHGRIEQSEEQAGTSAGAVGSILRRAQLSIPAIRLARHGCVVI